MDIYDSIKFHRMLVNDRVRTDTYRKAINQTVQDGDLVLDIGTGSGILAFLACQAGAERVYAVDNSDIINVARQLASENGFAERITFINDDIRNVKLSEKVDVIISELLSKTLIGQQMEELVAFSRKKFLKANGKIIPEKVEYFIAPVEADSEYRKLEFPKIGDYGIDFTFIRTLGLNQTTSTRLNKPEKLSDVQVAYLIDSYNTSPSQHPDANLGFTINKAGTLHGFLTWFSAVLADGITLSNLPPGTPSWDNLLFPLIEPLEVSPGMEVIFHLRGDHPKSSKPIWRWKTTLTLEQQTGARRVIADYNQSSFKGSILSKRSLYRQSSNYVPELSESGEVLKALIDLCNTEKKVAEISATLFSEFPDRWNCEEEVRDYVFSSLDGLQYSGSFK